MSTPGISWVEIAAIAQVIEAVVVSFSALAVIYQIKRMRRESIESKVSGVKAAVEVLDSNRFREISQTAMAETTIHGVNWRSLLDQVNLVALLITEKYTDEKLLLSLKGYDLATIEDRIRKGPIANDLKAELGTKYTGAYALLGKAREWRASGH